MLEESFRCPRATEPKKNLKIREFQLVIWQGSREVNPSVLIGSFLLFMEHLRAADQ